MKNSLMVGLCAALLSTQAFAQTADSKKYNLLSAGIDDQAIVAKAVLAMGAAEVNYQLAVRNSDLSKVCFRLGALMERAIGSSARYELHAVDTNQKARGQKAMKLAIQAATICGFKVEEVVNPEYAKITAGIKDVSEIGTASSAEQLNAIVTEIGSLASEK